MGLFNGPWIAIQQETFLLNITCAGNISTMRPRQDLFDGRLALIRPLAYVEKDDIEEIARVNGLSPGPVETPAFTKTGLSDEALNAMMAEIIKLVPLGRMGSTTELAKAALYLASDESSYTVGTELLVDGGMGSL